MYWCATGLIRKYQFPHSTPTPLTQLRAVSCSIHESEKYILPETVIVITETNTTITRGVMIQKHHLKLGCFLRRFTCKIFAFFLEVAVMFPSSEVMVICTHLWTLCLLKNDSPINPFKDIAIFMLYLTEICYWYKNSAERRSALLPTNPECLRCFKQKEVCSAFLYRCFFLILL